MYNLKRTNDDININLFQFSNTITKDDLINFQKDFDLIFSEKKTFFVIFNLLNISSFDMNFFITMLSYIHKNKVLVKEFMKASSIIVTSKFRPILNMALSIKKPFTPNFVTSDLNVAIEFLLKVNHVKN